MSSSPGQITFEHGRAFIPLAVSGCGVGCKYCYIDDPADEVVPLSTSTMDKMLDELRAQVGSPSPGQETLIAVGCDTEVAISPAIIRHAVRLFEFAQQHRLPVQLSTKFPLPDALRSLLDGWPLDQPRPVVFTTITTISLSAQLEPLAPPPAERAENFRPHDGAWLSYALVKPFLRATDRDADDLLALLADKRPDGVVVGVPYHRKKSVIEGDRQHPIAGGWMGRAPSVSALDFVEQLGAAKFRVFMNTRCVSAWHNSSTHGQMILRDSPYLCVDCGACQ